VGVSVTATENLLWHLLRWWWMLFQKPRRLRQHQEEQRQSCCYFQHLEGLCYHRHLLPGLGIVVVRAVMGKRV
jgi:hypothetical protein